MSGEAFQTPVTADLATAPDRRGVLVATSGSQTPRWSDAGGSACSGPVWASCYLNAEVSVRVAAEVVAGTTMDGLTGDHPQRRSLAGSLLHAAADLVRDLALDHAGDGELTDEAWQERLDAIGGLLAGASYPPKGLGTRRDSVHLVESSDV